MSLHKCTKTLCKNCGKPIAPDSAEGLCSVCRIDVYKRQKLGKPIRTFAIGMDTDAIDLKYARQTADYLGSEHHEIIINREMVLSSLEEVIRLLGTWDITLSLIHI